MAELSVDIEVNTGSAVSNVEKLGQSFSDAARELLEIVDAGKRAGKSTEDIARDISKKYGTAFDDAKVAVDKLDGALDEMRRSGGRAGDDAADSLEDVERAARDAENAVDDIGANGSVGLRRISDTSREVGEEVRQNLGEGIANAARGDFSALADTIGDTLGGAVAGIGGVGFAAAAAAGAVGVGALVAAFVQAEEKRKELEERAADLANAYIEAGSTVLDEITIAGRLASLATTTDPKEKQNVEDLTAALGDRAFALRVLAGDSAALASAQEILRGKEQELADLAPQQTENTGRRKTELGEEAIEVENLNRILGEQAGVQSSAAQSATDYSNALKQVLQDAGTATVQVDEFGNSIYTLPSGAQVLIDAETGQASTDVSNFKGDLNTIPKQTVADVRVRLDTSAWDNWTPRFKTGVVAANVRIGREWE